MESSNKTMTSYGMYLLGAFVGGLADFLMFIILLLINAAFFSRYKCASESAYILGKCIQSDHGISRTVRESFQLIS